jgi:hypothetical protein
MSPLNESAATVPAWVPETSISLRSMESSDISSINVLPPQIMDPSLLLSELGNHFEMSACMAGNVTPYRSGFTTIYT